MSALAESAQPLVAQPTKTVVFLARREELRLVKTPRYPQLNPASGQRLGESRGVTFAFLNGSLRLTPDEAGMVHIHDPGGAGEASLPFEEAMTFLTGHRRYGDVNEGFWKVDPTAPPVTREELDRIVRAATEFDRETLEAIVAQESAGWGREDILHVAKGSIERIDAMTAHAQEIAAEQTSETQQALDEERAQREKIEAQLKAAQDEAKKLKAAQAKAAQDEAKKLKAAQAKAKE
jgi:hypothetical protein